MATPINVDCIGPLSFKTWRRYGSCVQCIHATHNTIPFVMDHHTHILYTCLALHFHGKFTFSIRCVYVKKDLDTNKLNQTLLMALCQSITFCLWSIQKKPWERLTMGQQRGQHTRSSYPNRFLTTRITSDYTWNSSESHVRTLRLGYTHTRQHKLAANVPTEHMET